MEVDESTGEIAEERHIRPFADFLQDQRQGSLMHELSTGLNSLVDAVNVHGKGGSLTLTIAITASEPVALNTNVLYREVVPEDAQAMVLDLERFRETPDRKRGTIALHTAASFSDFINRHKDERSTIFADRDACRFIGVLNDADGEGAHWADHRAVLAMKHTPEWLFWTAQDGNLLSQADFAGHIEDGQSEVREPDAATLLELAQTFHAKTGVNFRQSTILQSGQRQLTYEETTAASAGHSGQITIPQEFILGVAPFVGSDAYKVTARLRFRLHNGTLSIGYQLVRPHEVIDAAFADAVEAIKTATDVPTFMGVPVSGVGR